MEVNLSEVHSQKSLPVCFKTTGRFIKKHLGIIGVVMICGVVARVFYTGLYLSDDFGTYLVNFFRLYRGEMLEVPFRLPLVFIEWLSYMLFGGKITSVPILFSFLYPAIVALVYAITYLLSKKVSISLIAAILCAGSSTLYVYSGAILPDNVGTFSMMAAFYFFIRYIQSEKKMHYGYMMLSVFFVLSTFLMREAYVIAFVIGFIPLAFYLQKDRNYKETVLKLIALLTCFGIVLLAYHLVLIMAGYGETLFDQYNYASDAAEWNRQRGIFTFMDRYRFSWELTIESFPAAVYMIWALGISSIIGLIKRQWDILAFSLSILVLWVVFCFAPSSINPYVFYPLQERYIAGIWALIPIPIALSLSSLKKYNRSVVIVGLILSTVLFIWNYDAKIGNAGNLYHSYIIDTLEQPINQAQLIRPNGIKILSPVYSRYTWYADYMYPKYKLEVFDKNDGNQISKNDILILNLNKDMNMVLVARNFAINNNLTFIELQTLRNDVTLIYFVDKE